ncbi:MAG: RpiB/LacA/LacB family sugar-phosphate isomerase [Ginsengibacter sp.]
MKIGIACDHGGFELKNILKAFLQKQGYEVKDFGAYELNTADDYPDFVIPLARAVSAKEVEKGVAICGSGVGASVAACKIAGVRAALIHEHFSAHQGVEDDDMNLICFGGRVTAFAAAEEFLMAFLNAKYIGAERHVRRLDKVRELEISKK